MHVDLPGEAHAAVHLRRRLRRSSTRGLAREQLGARDRPVDVAERRDRRACTRPRTPRRARPRRARPCRRAGASPPGTSRSAGRTARAPGAYATASSVQRVAPCRRWNAAVSTAPCAPRRLARGSRRRRARRRAATSTRCTGVSGSSGQSTRLGAGERRRVDAPRTPSSSSTSSASSASRCSTVTARRRPGARAPPTIAVDQPVREAPTTRAGPGTQRAPELLEHDGGVGPAEPVGAQREHAGLGELVVHRAVEAVAHAARSGTRPSSRRGCRRAARPGRRRDRSPCVCAAAPSAGRAPARR